jgi:hypothetical protein
MPVRPAAAPAAAAQGGPGVQGYVPADPGPDPEAPPRVGLTPVQQSIMRDIAAAPPGYRKGVAEKLDPFFKREEEARQRQQSQLDAEHTRKITENAKIREDRRKYQADQYERYYKGDEQKQKADAGQHVTVEGRLMIPDHSKPPGAPWVDVTAPLPGQIPKEGEVDPPPPLRKPLTAEQQKQVKFWSEMQLAEKQLQGKEELLANSPVDAAKGGIPVFGNALQSRNYKKAVGAAEFSVLADLRPDSGAAIGIIEDAKRYKQLMPVYGDSPGIIADKRRRRQAIMDANYATLGQDLQPSAKWIMDQTVKRQAADQKKINDEMAPKFAGKKLENGYVATKGKMKRIWDATGGNWVED